MGKDGPATIQKKQQRIDRWYAQFDNAPGLLLPNGSGSHLVPVESGSNLEANPGGVGCPAVPGTRPVGSAPLFKAHIPTEREKKQIGGGIGKFKVDRESPYYVSMSGSRVQFTRRNPRERTSQGTRREETFLEAARGADRRALARDENRKGGGKKQRISEFSTRSRRNMLYQVSSVDWDHREL